jgi:hypothetical protein
MIDSRTLAAFHQELEKLAEGKKEKVIGGFAAARPYVAEAFKAGVPAAVLGNIMSGQRLGRVMGVGGAGLGIANTYLRQWAEKNKRHKAAKQLLKEGQSTIRKVAAMAGDLRMKGLGDVKRPPFPTEDSKRLPNNLLKNSLKPGKFTTQTQPKHLIRPGPSITQTATLPTG